MKKFLTTTVKIVLFFVGWALLSAIDIPADDPAVWRFSAELIPLASMILFTVVFILIEKKTIKIPVAHNAGKGTLIGVIIGFVWIGISAGILLATHQLTITGKNEVSKLWLWIISAFINVVLQELLARGYIYQLLKTKYNMPVTIIVTTALFTLMHGGAFEAGLLPVLNVITMCLFTTALYEAEGTILAPIMAHAVWNIVGGIILGGVSLAEDYPNLYSMTPSSDIIFSGGSCKIEGSIVVLVINIALMLIFYFCYKKKVSKR
ncbi:MAG: CPBP family intramembrane glutamic endopeptidase [Eubacterium sp.]|jgi:membrane protease YdiL (CAAX protease family)